MLLPPLFDWLAFEGFFCVCCSKEEVSNFTRHHSCRQGEQPDTAEFFMGNFLLSNKHSLNLPLFYSFCNLIIPLLLIWELVKLLRISPWWCSELRWKNSVHFWKAKWELTNILTPAFTSIKSENQVCPLIAHNVVDEALGLRRWRLIEKQL